MTERLRVSMPVVLGETEIHVWLAFDQSLRDPALCEYYASVMSPDERERCDRQRAAADRHQQLVARGLQRTLLSQYAPEVPPARWNFARNVHGRPRIDDTHGITNLHFNVAHTHGLVAIAVARRPGIGVDVENFQLRCAPFAVARRYFSTAEADALEALSETQRQQRFYELWTLKEAYLKAVGTGLVQGLDRIAFQFTAAGARFDGAADQPDQRWGFAQFQVEPAHLLALAFLENANAQSVVRLREVFGSGANREFAARPRRKFEAVAPRIL